MGDKADKLEDDSDFSFFFYQRNHQDQIRNKHGRSNYASVLTKYYLHFMNKNLYSIYAHQSGEWFQFHREFSGIEINRAAHRRELCKLERNLIH